MLHMLTHIDHIPACHTILLDALNAANSMPFCTRCGRLSKYRVKHCFTALTPSSPRPTPYHVKNLTPLFSLAPMIRRPALVLIRVKYPCRRFCFRREGEYVSIRLL